MPLILFNYCETLLYIYMIINSIYIIKLYLLLLLMYYNSTLY